MDIQKQLDKLQKTLASIKGNPKLSKQIIETEKKVETVSQEPVQLASKYSDWSQWEVGRGTRETPPKTEE